MGHERVFPRRGRRCHRHRPRTCQRTRRRHRRGLESGAPRDSIGSALRSAVRAAGRDLRPAEARRRIRTRRGAAPHQSRQTACGHVGRPRRRHIARSERAGSFRTAWWPSATAARDAACHSRLSRGQRRLAHDDRICQRAAGLELGPHAGLYPQGGADARNRLRDLHRRSTNACSVALDQPASTDRWRARRADHGNSAGSRAYHRFTADRS